MIPSSGRLSLIYCIAGFIEVITLGFYGLDHKSP